MPKLKIGDKFIWTKEMNNAKQKSKFTNDATSLIGRTVEVDRMDHESYRFGTMLWASFETVDHFLPDETQTTTKIDMGMAFHKDLQIMIGDWNSSSNPPDTIKLFSNFKVTMTNLIDKAKLALKAEPFRSCQKAGVTSPDDTLTAEGTVLFLHWLFQQHVEEFKKAVVAPLIKDEEKK